MWIDDIIDIGRRCRNDWMERRRKDGSAFVPNPRKTSKRSRQALQCAVWLLSNALPRLYGRCVRKVPLILFPRRRCEVDEAIRNADEAELGHVRSGRVEPLLRKPRPLDPCVFADLILAHRI